MAKKKTTTQFINQSISVHYGSYTYDKTVYEGANSMVIVTCRIHGDFKISANNHLCGSGCRECWKQSWRLTTEQFIEKSQMIHGNTYDYSCSTFITSRDKIDIICNKHGVFSIRANAHLEGQGCPHCSTRKKSYSQESIIELFNLIHNNKYDYSLMKYDGILSRIIVICPRHGEFMISAKRHRHGQGCKKCVGQSSRVAEKWLDSLRINTLQREYSLPEYKKIQVDAYDPTTHTIYQFHGDYWHGNIDKFDRNEFNKRTNMTMGELYDKTLEKDQRLRDFGYNLIVMWENDWRKIQLVEKIL